MLVSELIEHLRELDQDQEVWVRLPDDAEAGVDFPVGDAITDGESPVVFIVGSKDYEDDEPTDDEQVADEPDEGDYIIYDAHGGGYGVTQLDDGHVGDFPNREDAEQAIREDAGNFYPNVWWQSDHGNNHLITDFKWD